MRAETDNLAKAIEYAKEYKTQYPTVIMEVKHINPIKMYKCHGQDFDLSLLLAASIDSSMSNTGNEDVPTVIESEILSPSVRKRGRPPKNPQSPNKLKEETGVAKKRGRPPKNTTPRSTIKKNKLGKTKGKRGRPRKTITLKNFNN